MLSLGFLANEERDGIWIEDPALMDVPDSAKADWEKDGSAAHLLPYARNGKPTVFKWRALNVDEARHMKRLFGEGGRLLLYECFALGVRFPDAPESTEISGVRYPRMIRDSAGFHRLSPQFLNAIERTYPDLIDTYGGFVLTATLPSVLEKKASSPPSTETPSSAADDTKPDTAAQTAAAA